MFGAILQGLLQDGPLAQSPRRVLGLLTTATTSRISREKLMGPLMEKRCGSTASSASNSPRSPSFNDAAAHDSHRGIDNAPTKKRPSSIDEKPRSGKNTRGAPRWCRRSALSALALEVGPCVLKPPLTSTQAFCATLEEGGWGHSSLLRHAGQSGFSRAIWQFCSNSLLSASCSFRGLVGVVV